jgi:hypothetical protein
VLHFKLRFPHGLDGVPVPLLPDFDAAILRHQSGS